MQVIDDDPKNIELLFDAVRHYRQDLEEFLTSGPLSEFNPKYKKELPFLKKAQADYRRCQILETHLKKQI